MQMARNLFFAPENASTNRWIARSPSFLAKALTELLSKDEVLEIYLNLVYFGNGAYGAEAAAKPILANHCVAHLVGSNVAGRSAPISAGLDPYTNFEGARKRQRTVLDLLVPAAI